MANADDIKKIYDKIVDIRKLTPEAYQEVKKEFQDRSIEYEMSFDNEITSIVISNYEIKIDVKVIQERLIKSKTFNTINLISVKSAIYDIISDTIKRAY
jgi:hypothetical protein